MVSWYHAAINARAAWETSSTVVTWPTGKRIASIACAGLAPMAANTPPTTSFFAITIIVDDAGFPAQHL